MHLLGILLLEFFVAQINFTILLLKCYWFLIKICGISGWKQKWLCLRFLELYCIQTSISLFPITAPLFDGKIMARVPFKKTGEKNTWFFILLFTFEPHSDRIIEYEDIHQFFDLRNMLERYSYAGAWLIRPVEKHTWILVINLGIEIQGLGWSKYTALNQNLVSKSALVSIEHSLTLLKIVLDFDPDQGHSRFENFLILLFSNSFELNAEVIVYEFR